MNIKTKPIDYQGCNEVIAERLQAGEAVWCEVWDGNADDTARRWIIGYRAGNAHRYLTDGGYFRCHAKPITKKMRVKKTSEIVAWLEDNGYWLEGRCYVKKHGNCTEECYPFVTFAKYAGELVDCIPATDRGQLLGEWLEED